MEEPLLGSRRRLSSSFTPSLSQIPEASQAINSQAVPIPVPSYVKEILIFGSPKASPGAQGIWMEYPVPHQLSSNGPLDSNLLKDGEDVCSTCGNLSKEMGGSLRQPQNQAFDSFLDGTMIGGSVCSAERTMANLTRLDLDVRALTPRKQSSAPRPIGIGSAFSRGNLDRDSACREPSAECYTCTTKKFHRSRTAPALMVIEDKAPDTKHASPKPQPTMTPGSVVTQAFIGLLLYLSVGVAIYIWKEDEFSGSTTRDYVDAIYFCIVTLCTIGYGDIAPTTPFAKIFSCLFVLVGFGFIDILLSSMVNYVLDRQEVLLLHSVTEGHHERTKKYLVDIKKGRMRIRMKVALAFAVVIACIGLGTFVMHFLETLGWLDSFYLACMSVTTVGYGDHAFTTVAGRLFASLWLLVSTLAVARSFLYLAEARIDRRHRTIAKLVLKKKITASDLNTADLDNDGSISKSDFVVYKLKQMGKIGENDVAEVCSQFNTLARETSGKITLSFLIDLHNSSLDLA